MTREIRTGARQNGQRSEARAEEFARRLADAYGEELVAVLLYGSAARGDFREGVSDLNLLVLLRDAGRGGSCARRSRWRASGWRRRIRRP